MVTTRRILIALCAAWLGCSGGSTPAPENSAKCTSGQSGAPDPGAGPARAEAIALVNEAVEAFKAGDPATAETKLRAAITRDPKLADAHANLGLLLLKQKRHPEAIKPLAAAVELEPENAKNHARYGEALARDGKHAAAIAELEIAVKADAKDTASRVLLADSYAAVNRHRDAALALTAAIADEPTEAAAYLRLARLYDRWRLTAQARAVLEVGAKQIADASQQALALHDLAVILAAEGERKNAIAALDRSLQLLPANTEALAQRGFIYAELGDRDRAVADLEAFVKKGGGSGFLQSAARSKLVQLKGQRRTKKVAVPAAVKLEASAIPEVPPMTLPKSADGSLSVLQARIERDARLGTEVVVKGVVLWKYDCRKALASPGRSKKEIEKMLVKQPELCMKPHFILGDKAGDPTSRGLWVVEVPRPPRDDEKKNLPKEMLDNWPAVPTIKVGDKVAVTGTFALKSPGGFTNSDGLVVYKSIKSIK